MEAVRDGDSDRVAAATEVHLHIGFSAILLGLTGQPGPDLCHADIDVD